MQGGVTAEIWSLGHRNPLGMAFDRQGQLWVVEMGPKGGDELNIITKGENYGYQSFQMETIIRANLFQIITLGQSLKHLKLIGPCNLSIEYDYLSRPTISCMAK